MSSTKKLATLRAQIAGLQEQRAEVESAPIPRDEAAARIAAVVNAPFSNTVINPGPQARVDLDPKPAGLSSGTFNGGELLQTLNRPSILRAVFPDALKAYLIGLYDEEIGNREPGLATAERRARLAELDAQIFGLEQQEESLIEALEADGADIQRRPSADPRAALGLGIAGEAA